MLLHVPIVICLLYLENIPLYDYVTVYQFSCWWSFGVFSIWNYYCHLNHSSRCNVLEYLCAAFKIFSLSLDFSRLIVMSLQVPFGGSLRFLYLRIYGLYQMLGNFSYIFSAPISFPLLLEFQWHKCKAYFTAPWDSTHMFFTFIFIPLVQKGSFLLIYFLVHQLLSPLFILLLSSLSTVYSYILY